MSHSVCTLTQPLIHASALIDWEEHKALVYTNIKTCPATCCSLISIDFTPFTFYPVCFIRAALFWVVMDVSPAGHHCSGTSTKVTPGELKHREEQFSAERIKDAPQCFWRFIYLRENTV